MNLGCDGSFSIFFRKLVDHDAKIFRFLAIFGSPNNLKQPPMRDRLPHIGNQMPQHFKLLRRQMDFLPAHSHPARFKIDGQFLGNEWRQSIRRRMAAERGPDTREKFLDSEGFSDVVIGASVEGNNFIPLGVAHREHNDRGIAGTADFPTGFDPADTGKIHVEKNQIGLELSSQFHGLFALEASQIV